MTGIVPDLIIVDYSVRIRWASRKSDGSYHLLYEYKSPAAQMDTARRFIKRHEVLSTLVTGVRRKVARFDHGHGFFVFYLACARRLTMTEIRGWLDPFAKDALFVAVPRGESVESHGWAPYSMCSTEPSRWKEWYQRFAGKEHQVQYPILDPAVLRLVEPVASQIGLPVVGVVPVVNPSSTEVDYQSEDHHPPVAQPEECHPRLRMRNPPRSQWPSPIVVAPTPDDDGDIVMEQHPIEFPVGLDPPHIARIADDLEPNGRVELGTYLSRGVQILNLDELTPHPLINVAPVISFDPKDPTAVSTLRLKTVNLCEDSCVTILRANRRFDTELSRIRQQIACFPTQMSTLGHDQRTAKLQRVHVKDTHTPGVYAIDPEPVRVPRRANPLSMAWNDRIQPSQPARSDDTYANRIGHLPPAYRHHLLNLPSSLSDWYGDNAGLYAAGVAGNIDMEDVLEIIGHPLADVLNQLPQGLMIAAMNEDSIQMGKQEGGELLKAELHEIYDSHLNLGSGTISSWAYGGNHHSVFPLHHEDAWMPSANVLVAGDPKVWIFIHDHDMQRVFRLVENEQPDPCFLFHRDTFLDPAFLVRHNIPFTMAVQQPGDLVIASAGSAHQGWNTGQNLAMAVNFLDNFSLNRLLSQVCEDNFGPWPCVCGHPPLPDVASKRLLSRPMPFRALRFVQFAPGDSDPEFEPPKQSGIHIFAWLHSIRGHLQATLDSVLTAEDVFSRIYRVVYLNE